MDKIEKLDIDRPTTNDSNISGSIMDMPRIFTDGLMYDNMDYAELLMSSIGEDDLLKDILSDSEEEVDYFGAELLQNVQDLFLFKEKFIPIEIEIPTKFSPNIPPYRPWPGEIGPQFWIPRFDHVVDDVGLCVLDEPSLKQTDPAILNLTLSRNSKNIGAKLEFIGRSIKPNAKDINFWISEIDNIRSTMPSKDFYYPKKMPEINDLMNEWPPELEELFPQISIPSSELSCDLKTYSNIVCNISGIPVHECQIIFSIHKLLSLYLEFSESQHFGKEKP